MTGRELARLASAAYGVEWKMVVKRELKISREMLWRYEAGRTLISPEREAQLLPHFIKLIIRRRKEIDALMKLYATEVLQRILK